MSSNESSIECSDDEMSVDSVEAEEVIGRVFETPDQMCYEILTTDHDKIVLSRSDLMDEGKNQRLILNYERRNPPDWDEYCPLCYADIEMSTGCEECWCPDCDNKCRFLNGINYGCCKHPVI